MVVCVYSSPLLNARGWCHLIFICWFTFRYVSRYVNVPLLIAALSSIFSKPLKCGDSKLTTIYFIPCLSKPMLMVVSILSPVKTHIFIPPWASLSMHPGTSQAQTKKKQRRKKTISKLRIKSITTKRTQSFKDLFKRFATQPILKFILNSSCTKTVKIVPIQPLHQ